MCAVMSVRSGSAGSGPQPGWLRHPAARPGRCRPLRRFIVAQGGEPVIPGRRHRKMPIEHDRERYRERNIVERGIGWFKQRRRLAMRFEKTASSYLGS